MKRKKFVRKAWIPLSCCLLVLLLFRFVFFLGYVPSASMEPTIPKNSFIIGIRLYSEFNRGDIVVFERNGKYLVKRIAAVPGDTIYLNDAKHSVFVNRQMIDATRILTVPEGAYFVLGDNMEVSFDSRYWKEPFVDENHLIAVFALY